VPLVFQQEVLLLKGLLLKPKLMLPQRVQPVQIGLANRVVLQIVGGVLHPSMLQ
jgi:hypothetical protein